ncbi:MAG: esterase family protein [Bryobacterales bacterium]|nr:esterase family protein [Bryobacterales bacterium]
MPPSLFTLLCAAALAQQTPPAPVISPEVHPDRRVTFRFRAPSAKEVFLSREAGPRIPMAKDDKGLWTLTTDPLEPDYYGYSFVTDGVSMMDPNNPLMKPNLLSPQSMVYVRGANAWDLRPNIAKGMLHRHFYHSPIVGDDRDYFVYTPPGYDPKASKSYPVLYLLHGFSDDASGWTAVGQAHTILDNLIADGKAKPMLIVMTLGYGAPEYVSRTNRDPALRERSFQRFRDALLGEVIPAVERDYRASKSTKDRAIAGLSMGGAESLFVGLNATERFSSIGAFSSGGMGNDLEKSFPTLNAKANDRLRLLWIACGVDDRLIDSNRKFLEFLKSKDVKYQWKETPGAHTWTVWRRYLSEFLPLLFR